MTDTEPERGPASENAADAWFTTRRFALLLGALIAITFSRVIAGSETFFYRDFGVFGYPLAHYQRECFWRGELPLWNPYNFCGIPYLAQWNTLTLYPPTLFYMIFPLSWSLAVFNLAHMFWGGLGMYLLARRWTGSKLAGTVAGLLYAFNGLTWHCLLWPNNISGLGWMPWVLLLVERAWREGGVRRITIAGLAGAMQMLTGAPEIILQTWILIGALWVLECLQRKIAFTSLITRALGIGLFVSGLTAAQLLPFLDLLKHSHRDIGFGSGSGWAMPLGNLGNFFAPLFRCYPSSQGVFVQYDQYWIPSVFLGAGAMMLAMMAAWRAKDDRVRWLVIIAVGSVWMALGANGHLYNILMSALPMLGFMRYPIKFIVLAMFIIPLLAGFGLKRWMDMSGSKPLPRKSLFIAAALVLAALGTLAYLEWQYPGVKDDWFATSSNIEIRAGFVALVTAALFCIRLRRGIKFDLGVRIALMGLLWLDVLTHAPNLTPTVERSVFETGAIRTALKLPPQPNPGEPRFMELARDMEKIHYMIPTNAMKDYLCRRLALFDDCNLLDDIPKTDGFYSLYLKETVQALSLVYGSDEKNVDLASFKDFLGIGYVSFSAEGNDKVLDWKPRDTAQPLITAGQKPIYAEATNMLMGLLDLEFNSRGTVYLPPEAEAQITAKRTAAKIISPEIGTQKMKFTVDSPAPAMVVIAESWYHCWHAYVDGKRVNLWHANHAFQALETPAGHHEVVIKYEDAAFTIGVIISLLSLTVAGIIIVRCRMRD